MPKATKKLNLWWVLILACGCLLQWFVFTPQFVSDVFTAAVPQTVVTMGPPLAWLGAIIASCTVAIDSLLWRSDRDVLAAGVAGVALGVAILGLLGAIQVLASYGEAT